MFIKFTYYNIIHNLNNNLENVNNSFFKALFIRKSMINEGKLLQIYRKSR